MHELPCIIHNKKISNITHVFLLNRQKQRSYAYSVIIHPSNNPREHIDNVV